MSPGFYIFASARVTCTGKAMQTTAIRSVAKSLPQNKTIFLIILISRIYTTLADLRIFCAGSTIFFPSAASRSIDGRRHGGLSFLPGKNKPAPIPGLMASGSGITRLTGAYLHPETQKNCIAPAAGRLKKPSGSPAAPWPPHNGVRPGRRKQCRRRNPPLRRMGTGLPDRDAPAWRDPLECARGSWCASHSQ